MNWEKFKNRTRATFKNPNFKSFRELGKMWKYSLRPTFKNLNLSLRLNLEKLCPNVSFTIENKGGN